MKLLDGGISDSIPVMKAIEDKYDKIIVILTRDKDYMCKPYKLMNAYKAKYLRYPKFIKTMENRFNKYNVTRDLITSLENEGKVFAIYPSKELKISNLEKDKNKLDIVYNVGYEDGSKIVKQVKDYLRR